MIWTRDIFVVPAHFSQPISKQNFAGRGAEMESEGLNADGSQSYKDGGGAWVARGDGTPDTDPGS